MSLHPTEDLKLKISPNEKLTKFVKDSVEVTKDIPENIIQLKNSSESEIKNVVLFVEDIKWLKKELKKNRTIYLHELLDNTAVSLPQPKFVPRNPELDARVKILEQQQKAREYALMTKNVDSVRKFHPEDTIAFQMNQINKQLIAVAQFVFSVITGFVFGFLGIELIVGNLDFGFRLLLGIMFALLVALAEIYFLAKKLNEDYAYETSTNTKVHQD